MSKRTLVSENLVCDVLKLLVYLESSPDLIDFVEVKRLCSSIEAEISEKIDKRNLRKAFTAYKTATPGPEREQLRKDYIELAQIRKSFTCDHEIPYSSLS